jgi:murein DD-endopeptidase MepM/ murein hydrolase activator NlpD
VKWTLAISTGAIAAMFAIPAFHWIESDVEAAASPSGFFRSELLVTSGPERPMLDRIHQLDHIVIANYRVGANEDLYTLCKKNHLDPFTIRSSNDLDVQTLQQGSWLKIPNRKGTLYEVKDPENLHTISQGYSRGKLLGAAYEREILLVNNYPAPDFTAKDFMFHPGTELFLPDAYKPTGLGLPFLDMHFRQTSRYGLRKHPVVGGIRAHRGVDLAKPYGSPVLTAREGTVTFAGWSGGYGQMIEVRHALKRKNGTRVLYTRYGHLSAILVHEGQHVHLYQLIGRVGSTGISTGPHLHFEVRDEEGQASNPSKFL